MAAGMEARAKRASKAARDACSELRILDMEIGANARHLSKLRKERQRQRAIWERNKWALGNGGAS